MEAMSRQYRRQIERIERKVKSYSASHRKFLMEQGPDMRPHRVGRPELTTVKTLTGSYKAPTGRWISPKAYPRQSARQAARYAKMTA